MDVWNKCLDNLSKFFVIEEKGIGNQVLLYWSQKIQIYILIVIYQLCGDGSVFSYYSISVFNCKMRKIRFINFFDGVIMEVN